MAQGKGKGREGGRDSVGEERAGASADDLTMSALSPEIRALLSKYAPAFKTAEVRARKALAAADVVVAPSLCGGYASSFEEVRRAMNCARQAARDAGLPEGEFDHDVFYLELNGPFSDPSPEALPLARVALLRHGDDEAVAWLDAQFGAGGDDPQEEA